MYVANSLKFGYMKHRDLLYLSVFRIRDRSRIGLGPYALELSQSHERAIKTNPFGKNLGCLRAESEKDLSSKSRRRPVVKYKCSEV